MSEVSKVFDELSREQQEFIVSWATENFREVKAINRKHSAYGLKQKFSRLHFYVTQEQFTDAMAKAGFKAETLKNGNAHFNIGQSSQFFKEC